MKRFKLKLVLDISTPHVRYSKVALKQKLHDNQLILQNYQACVGQLGHSWARMVFLGACVFSTCCAHSA